MNKEPDELAYNRRRIGTWDIPTLEFTNPGRPPLCVDIEGKIANSTAKCQEQHPWKAKVASAVKEKRGHNPLCPKDKYSVSVGLSFHPGSHGNQCFDLDNYTKLIIDAIAAGLFCLPETEPKDIYPWCYDDSSFHTLLFHRLPDAVVAESEGIAVCVSVTE